MSEQSKANNSPRSTSLWSQYRGTLAWLLLVILTGFGIYRVETLATDTSDALCGLKQNLETRIADSKQFLIDHPKGLPGVGITPAVIAASIERDQLSVNSLSQIDCPDSLED